MRVIVVGAGLIGPVIAMYLSKRGYRVEVYEWRPDIREVEPPPGKSIHLVLSKRGWKALTEVGFDGQVRRIVMPLSGRTIHSADGNLAFQPYGQEGQAIDAISRNDFNKLLVSLAEDSGIAFHFNRKCVDIEFRDGTVTFEDPRTGETFRAGSDLVIGADGAFSAVRQQIVKAGRVDYAQSYLSHGYKQLSIPASADGDWPLDSSTMHVWPRERYMLTAFPNLDGSLTMSLFLPYDGKPSFRSLEDEEDVQSLFRETFSDVPPLAPELSREYLGVPTSSLVTIRCRPWVFEDRAVLIGDAAHTVVPFYGQGMNAGFEDCSTLYRCLEEHGDDWTVVLAEFERLRKPNADALATLSLKNFTELCDRVGDPDFLLRKKIERRLGQEYSGWFFPMYPMVAFSHIPYAEALRIGEEQDGLIDRIMEIEDVREKWGSEEVDEVVHGLMERYQQTSGGRGSNDCETSGIESARLKTDVEIEYIDISPMLSGKTAVFPGDTAFELQFVREFEAGDHYSLSAIRTTPHVGAHADAPYHYHPRGETIDSRKLSYYLGPCQVIEAMKPSGNRIFPEDIDHVRLEAPRVLFKTMSFPNPERFDKDFISLSPALIDHLAERNVVLVGVDTPSIDPWDSKGLESHRRVYHHDMAILEQIDLRETPPGLYFLIALPLKIKGGDASPVRAVLLRSSKGRDRPRPRR